VVELVLVLIYMVAPAALTYGAFASGCVRGDHGDHGDEQSGANRPNKHGETLCSTPLCSTSRPSGI
jgi:hypothetical protein